MTNITEGQLDFKTFERTIFEIMCRIACELIRQYLEWRDLGIMALRDKKEYRLIDIRGTTVKSLMGGVTFGRRYYRKKNGEYVFLLDEAIGLDCGCGLVSENLAEQIVTECADKPFRKAAGSVSVNTGQTISRMGAWHVVQRYGEKIEQQEARLRELEANESAGHLGNIPTRVLFEERDDVWISMQRGERRKRGAASGVPGDRGKGSSEAPYGDAAGTPDKGAAEPQAAGGKSAGTQRSKTGKKADKKPGRKPMHVGIAYTGWKQEKDGRFSTVDKMAYASFGEVPGFTSVFGTLLSNVYDMDGVERRLTNGDGEPWIRTEAEANDSILQLDPYHRGMAVIKAVGGKNGRKRLFDAIAEKNVDKVLGIIANLREAAQDEKEREKLRKLYEYFNNNRDILLTWKERGIELPPPPDGVVYREMGVQESSNGSLITQRMKHNRSSWSPRGGSRMAKILCIRDTIGLDALLGPLPEPGPGKPWAGPLSAAKAPQHDGKGYGAEWLHAEMPFEQAFRTNGREAIRGMLRMQQLSQLAFR